MATEIHLTTVMKRERGDRIAAALKGQTYMDFYVNVCPCQGSFAVNVGTLQAGITREELTDMVLDVLAGMIA